MPRPAPRVRSGSLGSGVSAIRPRNTAADASTPGRVKSCSTTSRLRSVEDDDRVTIRPAASEIRNAGTWLTRPSPIVSLVKTLTASPRLMPWLTIAQEQPAADIDQQDHDAGDRVAADELARPVHGAEEVGLAIDLLAAAVGLVLVDQPGVQVGVDRHLPAGQPVEHEPRGHLADAGRPLGDHHELDHDQDREQDHADDHLVAGDELAERPDHAAGRLEPVVAAAGQHQPGRRHVQHQPRQRGRQQDRRKRAELLRGPDRQRRQAARRPPPSGWPRAGRRATAGGIGTTNTRIAPMMVTGRTRPAGRPAGSRRARRRGRHPFPSTNPKKCERPNGTGPRTRRIAICR